MRRLHLAALGTLVAACSVASPSATAPLVTTPPTQGPTIPAVEPTATSAPSPTADPALRLSAIPPMLPGGWAMPVAVVSAESGLVAVGGRQFRDPTEPAGGTAGAWRSDDGLTWEPANPDGLTVGDIVPESGPEAGLVDVAWGPDGFVAVGYAFAEAGGKQTLVGGAWHSVDGRSWTRRTASLWDLARPTAVTWSGTQYVVVGVAEDEAAPRAAVWYSPDGLAWKRAPDAPVFDVGTYMDTLEYHGWGGPQDVTATEDGVLYAVGRTCRDSAEPGNAVCRELIWRSADATTWTQEDLGPAAADTVLTAIAVANGRMIVGGGPVRSTGIPREDPARVLVRGSDGWELVELAGARGLPRLIRFGTGFLAATAGELWASDSGDSWTPVTELPSFDAQAFDVAQFGAGLVGVGWTSGYPDGEGGGFAVIWTPASG